MNREQYSEMIEFVKEEPDTVMDYLEVNYDELSKEDIAMLYRLFVEETVEIADEDEKEQRHRILLDAMYEMSEEHNADFLRTVAKVKNYLE